MRSTMMDVPLLVSRILTHGSTVHASSEVATWTADGARRTSFAQVGRDAARLAHALRDLGITGDQRVGTFMWNNAEHLIAYLGVPSMGAVLHTVNIRLFPEQLAYVVNHAEDRVILLDATLAAPFAALMPQLRTVRHVIVNTAGAPVADDVRAALAAYAEVHDYATLIEGRPDTFDWPMLDEHDAASMCYTSGTTGNPKGVVYSHRSTFLHSMYVTSGEAAGLRQGDRVLPVVPMFHANAWGLPYAAFLAGASIVMPDRFLQAAPLAAMIAAERPTHAGAVPTIWNDLLDYLAVHPTDVSSLGEVIVGGSACPPALMRAYDERHGIRILHGWGMTEMSPLGTLARPPAGLHPEEAFAYRVTQGRLAGEVEARLIGADGTEQPWDGKSVGELEVRGPWIAGSYYQDPDPTKFDDGWLRTGDVGALSPDGYLTLTDRAKDVIKSGGEWISSVELENQLMGHPAVKEASVVGVPDERWGERPLATVVVREGASVTPQELRAFLADRVAHWQLPERWAFIDEVPKTSVGKFDKKVIRSRFAAGDLAVEQVG
ncbi:MAG: long-chain fatty acid--CoA ligase [Kineosporiaceae bacterium]